MSLIANSKLVKLIGSESNLMGVQSDKKLINSYKISQKGNNSMVTQNPVQKVGRRQSRQIVKSFMENRRQGNLAKKFQQNIKQMGFQLIEVAQQVQINTGIESKQQNKDDKKMEIFEIKQKLQGYTDRPTTKKVNEIIQNRKDKSKLNNRQTFTPTTDELQSPIRSFNQRTQFFTSCSSNGQLQIINLKRKINQFQLKIKQLQTTNKILTSKLNEKQRQINKYKQNQVNQNFQIHSSCLSVIHLICQINKILKKDSYDQTQTNYCSKNNIQLVQVINEQLTMMKISLLDQLKDKFPIEKKQKSNQQKKEYKLPLGNNLVSPKYKKGQIHLTNQTIAFKLQQKIQPHRPNFNQSQRNIQYKSKEAYRKLDMLNQDMVKQIKKLKDDRK